MQSLTVRLPNEMAVKASNLPSIPSEHEMMVYHTMAEQAVSSKMYRSIGEKAGVMMIMLAARELGIPPMQALNGGLNIINGKVEVSAGMMSALIRRAGHTIGTKEETPTKCTLYGKRIDNGQEEEASFTLEEAKAAGLIKSGGAWTKCPPDMLWNRALSRLKRRLFSDVIGVGYIQGEVSGVDAAESVTEIQPEISNQSEILIEDLDHWIETFQNVFSDQDKSLSMEYLNVVMTHFKWDTITAIKELLNDKNKLLEKFQSWKSKITKAAA